MSIGKRATVLTCRWFFLLGVYTGYARGGREAYGTYAVTDVIIRTNILWEG